MYADGTNSPTALVSSLTNQWVMTALNGLKTNSTHWFQVAYSTLNGRQSPLSAATTNMTWAGRVGAAFLTNGWRHSLADIPAVCIHEFLAGGQFAGGSRRAGVAEGVSIGWESVRLQHLAANGSGQDLAGKFRTGTRSRA